MSNPERSGLYRAARALDEQIFRVEKSVVSAVALVMTTLVFLDICYRAFRSDESVVAQKLLAVAGWFGVEATPARLATLTDWVAPGLLALLAFLAGLTVFLSGQAQRAADDKRPGWVGGLYGLVSLGLSYGFVRFLLAEPSWVICLGLVILGAGGYLAVALRAKDALSIGLALAFGVFGGVAATKVPEGYIWSQELALILLSWMAFLGGSMATRLKPDDPQHDNHLTVDAFARVIPAQLRPLTRALGLWATALFCAYFFYLAYAHVFGPKGDYMGGEVRPATGIPAWTILFAAVVAFAIMSLRFGARALDATLRIGRAAPPESSDAPTRAPEVSES